MCKMNLPPLVQPDPASRNAMNANQNAVPMHLQNRDANIPPLIQRDICALCTRNSISVCDRCGEFYCSPECQLLAWRDHRQVCFPMPPLVLATEWATRHSLIADALTSNKNLQPRETAVNNKQDNAELQQPQSSQNSNDKSRSSNIVSVIPKVNVLPQLAMLEPPAASQPKEGSQVMITGFHSSNRCYVRSLENPENSGYQNLFRTVAEYALHAPPLTTVPSPNSYAIASYDGIFHRVQILQKNKGTRVYFVDVGHIRTIRSLKDLREISQDILAIPLFTSLVQLKKVPNIWFDTVIREHLSQYEGCGAYRINYHKSSLVKGCMGYVDLSDWKTEKLLNDKIIKYLNAPSIAKEDKEPKTAQRNLSASQQCLTVSQQSLPDPQQTLFPSKANSVSSKTSDEKALNGECNAANDCSAYQVTSLPCRAQPRLVRKPVMMPPFQTRVFEETAANIDAIVLDNSSLHFGYVGCIAKNNSRHLAAVQDYLSNYIDTKIPYKPKVEEYCLAKLEDTWYRAKVIEVLDGEQFAVVYIDFTNEKTLMAADIRRYPIDLKIDCCTNLCIINGIPEELTALQEAKLKSLLPVQEQLFIDRIISRETDITLIECKHVLNNMKDVL